MAYKFVDISSLFERFSIDAFDIVSGELEAKREYTGFFGDSAREIYVKVVQNKVETKTFVRDIDTHEYGFATDIRSTLYRYFLPLDALKELEKDYVSFEEKDKIGNFLFKFGKFSDFEDFEYFHMGTLTSGDDKGLIGITDYGDEVRGKFFRPLREGEGLTIKGIKMPVPELNINPIPSLPREDVDKAIDNFDKEVEKHNELIPGKKKFLDKIEEDLREGSKTLLALHANPPEVQYSVYKDKLYKYTGDFKYEDQIKEIMEEFDWTTVAQMARIKYRSLGSNKANYPEESLISMFKEEVERMLRELLDLNCGRVSCGLFTVYNDGGVLSLEFTPEGWEGSTDEENIASEEIQLSEIKFC